MWRIRLVRRLVPFALAVAGGAALVISAAAQQGGADMKQIMNRLGRGQSALPRLLDRELQADQPAWETIQPQTAELVKLAADLDKTPSPRGSKDAWSKLTAAFDASATALAKAATDKDLDAARTAQAKLGSSCQECHRQFRGGGRGDFGFAGPDGPGGRGPGGPPLPGQVLSPFVQERLNLTADQKKQLGELQMEVDDKLAKILTDEQQKQLKDAPRGFGPGGPGERGPGGPGRGGPGGRGRSEP
jgi:cytochrome c556